MRQQRRTGARHQTGIARDQQVGLLRFAHVQAGRGSTTRKDLQLLCQQPLLVFVQTG
ncbi:hypothetical protein D3C78_1741160 [compost metagenome]